MEVELWLNFVLFAEGVLGSVAWTPCHTDERGSKHKVVAWQRHETHVRHLKYFTAVRTRQIRDTSDDSMMGESAQDSEYDSDESTLADSWDSNDDLSSDEGERRPQEF